MATPLPAPGEVFTTWLPVHAPRYRRDEFFERMNFIRLRLVRLVLSRTAAECSLFSTRDMRVVASFQVQRFDQLIEMPVVRIVLHDSNTEFTIFYDFNNWFVSVDTTDREVNIEFVEFLGTFDQYSVIVPPRYGLDKWVYESYANNKCRFTVVLSAREPMFTFFWIFTRKFLKYTVTGCFGEGPSDD